MVVGWEGNVTQLLFFLVIQYMGLPKIEYLKIDKVALAQLI